MANISTLLENIIQPARGGMAKSLAKYVLSLGFSEADKKRYVRLANKAKKGKLTSVETQELDDFLTANDFLTIIKAKATGSLDNGRN